VGFIYNSGPDSCFRPSCYSPNCVELMKDEEEDMAHQVAAKLVKDNEYEVQKAEEAKDLDSEPQGLEELVSRCFCAGSNNALCCGGICGPPDDGLCIYRRSQKPPL